MAIAAIGMISSGSLYARATDSNLAKPSGTLILTVSGAIAHTSDGKSALFDIEQLKAIGDTHIRTATPWTMGETEFVGVPFKKLFDTVSVQGKKVTVTALNDYSATMNVSTLTENNAILAYEMDGKLLSVRDKGPLWVIFPFDADTRYRTDEYWSKSVWQVKSITIE